MQQKLNNEGVI